MSTTKQLIVSAAANLGTIASGMALGFSAVALPAMQMTDHVPHVSEEQASWVASLTSIGMPAGCLLMGPLLTRLGRRRTLMLVNFPSVLGWLLIATAPHSENWPLYLVYVGRLLTGISTGLVSTAAVVYVSEVIDRTLRGVVVTWPSLGVALGILIVYVLGSIFQENWRLVAGISTCVPIISIALIWYILPESPVWLLARGNVEEAELCMRKIRHVPLEERLTEDMQKELDAMMASNTPRSNNRTWRDDLAYLKRPEAYKPLLIFNSFFFFQQFSGIYVIIFYAVNIIRESGVNFDGYLATVLIGVSRVVITVIISYASKRFGRRMLCNVSGIGMTLSTGSLAIFLSLSHGGTISHETLLTHSWFPITALLLCVLTGTLGFLTLPFAMIGEVFPAAIRGSAAGFCTFMATIFCFMAVKLYPEMRLWMGYHNVFTFYTVIIVVGTIVMYFVLPETQGKTLEEVEDFFRNGGKASCNKTSRNKLLPTKIALEGTR
ncbi:facilitated trehalose transporter Tret1-like isoform X2 [Periplaneta americana]|uniref:facilitated trehalose transporter Tret1-like isoform X2 n=1 Tax=Periplaneta americana TaxID=6978 RepID=UPI0037E904EE